ncbi:protein Gawky-like [Dreissena polymorpha]|uniref:protein Gawky-like n=1 Tax=Dreissena polymorpha TaxID=45954 RepID=UPI00226439BF|nr:protein Gawky-like [Dreissena polymorpha]
MTLTLPQIANPSRLLQQLTDMGFKKDDAQRALINNNMNIQGAIANLYRSSGAKKDDFEIARMSGLLPTNDDISDTQLDSNSFVPNLNHMQNTPFNNAQSKIPNQFPFNNGPSLNQSSLGSNNPSINSALQQIFMQKYPTQPPPTQQMNSMNPGQGPLGPGQPPGVQSNPNVHQQMAQQQILNQLRMAGQAGLISPQLLNRQLPTHVLVMLKQLLQHQQNLQQLIHTQLTLQQNKLRINPHMLRQQLEEIINKVHIIKQQILMLTKNISAAQKSLLDKPDSCPYLSLQPTSQPQSRLNQWKKPTPDKESPDGASNSISNTASTVTSPTSQQDNAGDTSDLNKTVGSKPIQQANPTPNLRRYDELGLPALGGDSPWSSGGNLQNWPNSTSSTDNESSDNSESLLTTAASTVSRTSSSFLDPIPTIHEFVPGKPWQGISAKNVEDDPHIKPGSFSRSLSVNTVKDDYLLTLTKSSPNSDNNSSWPSKSSDGDHKPWSAGGDNSLTPTSFSSEVWGMHGKNSTSRPPPGLPQQHLQQQQKWAGINRPHSWAGSATRHDGRGNWGEPQVSTVLCLQNILPSTDGATLRTLCMQHGPLQHFYLNLSRGEAIVKYRSMEEASKAQKALNNCLLGNTTILANFLSDTEAQQYIEMQQSGLSGGPGASQWSQGGGQQHPRSNLGSIGGGRGGNMGMGGWGGSMNPAFSMSGGSGMWGNSVPRSMNSGGGLWGAMDDNGPHNLLGNMQG